MRTQIDNGGAIIAANDSDITQFGGDHYSYCWPRDGALVAYSLILTGQGELSRNFFRYCARVIGHDGYFLHKYTPTGDLASSWHPWMLEGVKILPIQQDETVPGALGAAQALRDLPRRRVHQAAVQLAGRAPAEWMLAYRDQNGLPLPSWDLWEERRGIHTFTVAATIGALEAAAAFRRRTLASTDRARVPRRSGEACAPRCVKHLWNPTSSASHAWPTPLADGQVSP